MNEASVLGFVDIASTRGVELEIDDRLRPLVIDAVDQTCDQTDSLTRSLLPHCLARVGTTEHPWFPWNSAAGTTTNPERKPHGWSQMPVTTRHALAHRPSSK